MSPHEAQTPKADEQPQQQQQQHQRKRLVRARGEMKKLIEIKKTLIKVQKDTFANYQHLMKDSPWPPRGLPNRPLPHPTRAANPYPPPPHHPGSSSSSSSYYSAILNSPYYLASLAIQPTETELSMALYTGSCVLANDHNRLPGLRDWGELEEPIGTEWPVAVAAAAKEKLESRD